MLVCCVQISYNDSVVAVINYNPSNCVSIAKIHVY